MTTPVDSGQLVPMVAAVRTTTGRRAKTVLADKGYLTEAALQRLHRRRPRCLVAVGREGKRARWPRGRSTQRMTRVLDAKRKTQGERPFAEIKQAMSFRRVQLRGLATVAGEWNLVSAACNLRRLCALRGAPA